MPTQLKRFSSQYIQGGLALSEQRAMHIGAKNGRGLPFPFLLVVYSFSRVEKSASLDLRAPGNVIDGRLRRVIPTPAMATEGESGAWRTLSAGNRVPARRLSGSQKRRKGERKRAQSCSQGSPEDDIKGVKTKSTPRTRKESLQVGAKSEGRQRKPPTPELFLLNGRSGMR